MHARRAYAEAGWASDLRRLGGGWKRRCLRASSLTGRAVPLVGPWTAGMKMMKMKRTAAGKAAVVVDSEGRTSPASRSYPSLIRNEEDGGYFYSTHLQHSLSLI
jgi:hypothetical protein